ncbi:hypothetical protein L873DRAFT_1786530 [Choiromyces venosus 120613-1]|uniref:Uncharacterized protein n=1 Tax=Choiromyces venosus 120613-1 TaxID=1336337 RepID=A0A3N4K457_9PEZI|nr:hypothetical protein L873DRAFT_1786530 [Choiromyces venosus 120613-1]
MTVIHPINHPARVRRASDLRISLGFTNLIVPKNGKCFVYIDNKFRVHVALVARIEQHQKLEAVIAREQELGRSRMTPTSEDSDIDMASDRNESEDDGYVLVGQSEEVRCLKQQQC